MSARRVNWITLVKAAAGVAFITLLAWKDLPHGPLIGMSTSIGLSLAYVMAVLILTMRTRRTQDEGSQE